MPTASHRFSSRAVLAAVIWMTTASSALAGRTDPLFSVTDLGGMGGSYTVATGINSSGQVVGMSYPADYSFEHAFRTAPNAAIDPARDDLGPIAWGGDGLGAYGINDSGQIVVNAQIVPGSYVHAFRTSPNAVDLLRYDLGTLGGAGGNVAYGINASGQVAGYSIATDGSPHAFRTASNAPIDPTQDDLGTLGGWMSLAYGINASGQVVGYSRTADDSVHAFRTASNAPINPILDDLGTLGGSASIAYGINASGQVVGGASLAGETAGHAFRTAPNAPIRPIRDDLGSLGGSGSCAYGINASGLVVGFSYIAEGSYTQHAFLYTNARAMTDLNSKAAIGTSSGFTITEARGINDKNQIVANGSNSSGTYRAFLLTPVLEKYKQAGPRVGLPGDINSNWGPREIYPGNQATAMSRVGCLVTSLTSVATFYLADTDPGEMLTAIQGVTRVPTSANPSPFKYITQGGSVSWRTLKIDTPVGRLTPHSAALSLNSIGNYVRDNGPVMLRVPSWTHDPLAGQFHFVVAYGITDGAPVPGDGRSWNADQIIISDPGHTMGYTLTHPGGDTQKEQVTLFDYFAELDAKQPNYSFDAKQWFDAKSFTDTSGTATYWVPDGYRGQMTGTWSVNPAKPSNYLSVHSPVDLIITDPVTGKRYTSSAALAQPEDIILNKLLLDQAFDEESTDPLPEDPYPAYDLILPDELDGRTLSVQMMGIGDGEFEVQYVAGLENTLVSDPLTGTITNGQAIDGQFTVIPAPEPASLSLLAFAGIVLLVHRRKAR